MKYVNAISTEQQFRLFADRIVSTNHKIGFGTDKEFRDQLDVISRHWTPEKFHFDLGCGDCALAGPSAGLAILFLIDSIIHDYTIDDKYVFSGIILDDSTFEEPGDIPDKLPYLLPGQFLIVGDSSCQFRGGVFGLENQIIRGDLPHLLEYFRVRETLISVH